MTGSKGKRLDCGWVAVCKKTLKTKSFTRRRFTNLTLVKSQHRKGNLFYETPIYVMWVLKTYRSNWNIHSFFTQTPKLLVSQLSLGSQKWNIVQVEVPELYFELQTLEKEQ